MINTMSLIEHYQKYFYVARANTPELLEQAFKLRYEVFVKDCGYKLGDYDEIKKTEKDSYDDQARHCLLFHKPSNQPIGYIRLIPYNKKKGFYLPIENYGNGKDFFDHKVISVKQLRTNKTGELSRLSIHPLFRRRLSDQLFQLHSTDNSNNKRYSVSYLPMCLILACGVLMYDNNIEYTVALMEKRLANLIKKFGVVHQLIGKSIDYHGMRSPYLMFGQRTYVNLSADYQRLYEVIHNELHLTQNLALEFEEK